MKNNTISATEGSGYDSSSWHTYCTMSWSVFAQAPLIKLWAFLMSSTMEGHGPCP